MKFKPKQFFRLKYKSKPKRKKEKKTERKGKNGKILALIRSKMFQLFRHCKFVFEGNVAEPIDSYAQFFFFFFFFFFFLQQPASQSSWSFCTSTAVSNITRCKYEHETAQKSYIVGS